MLHCSFPPCSIDRQTDRKSYFDFYSLLVPAGNIILPGNLLSLTYYGRSCSLRVEAVRGEDGVTLQRPAPAPGQAPDTEESSMITSVLDSTPADLSLQLSLLTVEDSNNAEGPPGTPGEPGPAASTPRRPIQMSSLSSPAPSPFSPAYNSQDPPPPAAPTDDSVSLESSVISESRQREKIPTAPSGGALNTDTFYCLSTSTKVTLRHKAGREDPDGEAKSSKVTYSMIGGLSTQLDVIRETIELPLKHPELFSNYGRSGALWGIYTVAYGNQMDRMTHPL